MMEKRKKKDYGKPLMVMEKFVPNEFVAGCLLQSRVRYHDGVICYDHNSNGMYDAGEGRGTGSDYSGFSSAIDAGDFEVLERGRKTENGALGYLYVGSGSFDYNMYPHQQDGTASTYYNYHGRNFVPCYYAKIRVKLSETHFEETEIFLGEDGLGSTTNAS